MDFSFNDLMHLDLTNGPSEIGELFIENLKEFLIQQQMFSGAMKKIRTKLDILDEEFRVLHDHNPIHHIEYRLKSPSSIKNKLERYELPLTLQAVRDNLYDVAGVRVICHYVKDIYLLRDLLLGQDDIRLLRERDFIEEPKDNGYRSLHLVVGIPLYLSEGTVEVPVEIQLRTISMDFWASLEHEIKYKSPGNISPEISERLKSCAQEIHAIENKMQDIHREVFNQKEEERP